MGQSSLFLKYLVLDSNSETPPVLLDHPLEASSTAVSPPNTSHVIPDDKSDAISNTFKDFKYKDTTVLFKKSKSTNVRNKLIYTANVKGIYGKA